MSYSESFPVEDRRPGWWKAAESMFEEAHALHSCHTVEDVPPKYWSLIAEAQALASLAAAPADVIAGVLRIEHADEMLNAEHREQLDSVLDELTRTPRADGREHVACGECGEPIYQPFPDVPRHLHVDSGIPDCYRDPQHAGIAHP